jgi:hypothetical protein
MEECKVTEHKLYVDYGRNDTKLTDDKNNEIGALSGNIPTMAEAIYKLAKKKGYELYIDTKVLGIALYDYLTWKYSDLKVRKY